MHNMSDELAKLDSNIMTLSLKDLKIFVAVLVSGYFFFSADRARKDSTRCFIHLIVYAVSMRTFSILDIIIPSKPRLFI